VCADSNGKVRDGPGEMDHHLGARITEARQRTGLHPARLADEIGVSEERLLAYENGQARIPAVCIARLSRTLGVTPRWFFKGLPGQQIFGRSA